jgi:hypothetical protein
MKLLLLFYLFNMGEGEWGIGDSFFFLTNLNLIDKIKERSNRSTLKDNIFPMNNVRDNG